ncbi:DHH family phosphoesterase [Sulfuricurvum sp.]|uniref:DHH family phosphoesterase n=1 Tax=Sulfuricurvum sp. TaxID=2025608 RepID=UPI003BB5FCFF
MPQTLIDASQHIVLIAHKNPDADSLGAACAFYSYLLRTQKKVTLFCASTEIDPHLAFLPWFDKLTNRFPKDANLMISFDCGSFERLGIETELPLINFDHHRSNNFYGLINVINTDAISTTEVVYDYFVTNDIKMNGKMALSLYAGLIEDSKCFRARGCNVKIFKMAYSLIELGANHAMCIEWLYHRNSLASLRIRGILLKQMKLFEDGRLALFEVPLSLLEETGAVVSECKKVLDEALTMRNIQASLMVLEQSFGSVKLSLRTNGMVDAAKIMTLFGGGGHMHRAGTHLKQDDYDELVKDIKMMITKELV